MPKTRLLAVIATTAAALLAFAGSAVAATDISVPVSTGSPPTPFSQNKQNEPALAVDPMHPNLLVAGANDEIDMEACAAGDPTTCPFTQGVGVSGVYFSVNSGKTWSQPTYQGWTARGCVGPAACHPTVGPIGTLPGYYEAGLVSDGDPSLAFGPKPGAGGKFSWSNGSRLYYANLASNFATTKRDETFKGAEAIAVSRTDNVTAAANNDSNAWMAPVIVSRQSSATFSDKEQIWADNATSSPYFGNVYVCNVSFRSNGAGAPEPVMFHRSTDGGTTWRTTQLSAATNNNQTGGRQGCVIRTDSHGAVYVVWSGYSVQLHSGVFYQAKSTNGGATFSRPKVIAVTAGIGQFDPVQGRFTIDGVAGSRTDVFPSLDIANGAPTGAGAPDTIVLAWADNRAGPNDEKAYLSYSTDGGASYSAPKPVSSVGDRANQPAVAIAPNGSTVYVTYNAYLQVWKADTSAPRNMQGVVVTLAGVTGTPTEAYRGPEGDARGSSANALAFEFLGDYNFAVATNSYGAAVWNDVRNAADCPAIDAYRQSLVDRQPAPRPAPGGCRANSNGGEFGNSDIYGWTSAP